MTPPELTALLVQKVMGWTVHPNRYLMENRRWTPAWRFQPAERLADAFRLLERAAPVEYSMHGDSKGNFRVQVRIGETNGEACGASKPRVITCAVARAVGIRVEGAEIDAA
jgi:hypothetical protein